MSLAVAVRRKGRLPLELWASCFHATSTQLVSKRFGSKPGSEAKKASPKPSSRTRLVKDLKPRAGPSSSSRLKVAPSKSKARSKAPPAPPPPPPVRDAAPHTEATDTFKEWENRKHAGRMHRERLARRASSPAKPSKRPSSWQKTLQLGGLPDFDKPWHSGKGKERAAEETDAAPASSEQALPRKRHVYNPLSEEFDVSSKSVSTRQLPSGFSSPPLMDGLRTSVTELLGPDAKPTPIQALSLKHLFKQPAKQPGSSAASGSYHQCLLASETGSGKSLAYLLPMLQHVKQSELRGTSNSDLETLPASLNPRGLVLAPTHELSRQLSGFAKALLHEIKLRVFCASRANMPSRESKQVSASQMAREMDDPENRDVGVRKAGGHAVDIVVGTPSKILEMAKGRGWDYEQPNVEDSWDKDDFGKPGKGRAWTVGKPEMGLSQIEWVVVDEADVLFDPDFQEHTRRILAEISEARGHPVPFDPALSLEAPGKSLEYPFNLLLTTATIPASLATYLDTHHPSLIRLASPNLHHLPSTLKTEYSSWTGGNKNADVEHRIRRVWADDVTTGSGHRSKILIFCNKSTKVEELGKYLQEKAIPNVALTSTSETRRHGSNHHLDGFLRGTTTDSKSAADGRVIAPKADDGAKPYVMITTSLLSRGLDFSPDIKHVFIVDEPRNMVDFLHRAGRSGRAGEAGKVVVFGKTKGRGSERTRDMKKKVGALTA